MCGISQKTLIKMGNCFRRSIPPPPTAAQHRLENLRYNRWSEFVDDVVLGYGNQMLKFQVDVDLRIEFDDGIYLIMPHRIGFHDYVIWKNMDHTRKQLRTYMNSPYYYIDRKIHFHHNVVDCKYVLIKKFVVLK